uniref:Transmembrane protein 213 n=1 Tax=Rattus norvegicus TaxID=10116 RepID=A0ABK0L2C6_RAT
GRCPGIERSSHSDFSLSLFQSQAQPRKDPRGQSPPAASFLLNVPWPCLSFSSEQTHFTTQRRCRKRAFHHREQDGTVFTEDAAARFCCHAQLLDRCVRPSYPAALFTLTPQSSGNMCEASSGNSTLSTHHPDPGTLEQCANVDFCPLASLCCRASVDEYGWIAAAVGWSFWFLTLILLCVDKLMKLTPEEPKDLAA